MKIKTRAGKFFLLYLFVLCVAGSFYTNSSYADARIYGTIADLSSANGNLSDVEININGATYFSDAAGQYTTELIEPGPYVMSFSATGYQTITFGIDIEVEDDTLERNIGMTIPAVAFNIRDSIINLPIADIDAAYETRIAIEGGTFPYVFSLTDGYSLPSGLNIDPETGVISGTPDVAGTYTFYIEVTDDTYFANREFTLIIAGPLTFETTEPPAGLQGRYYDSQLTVSGGIAPYEYTISEGSLPFDLSLESTTGTISGNIPSDASTLETYDFTVTVTDDGDRTTEETFSFIIVEDLIITTISLADGIADEAYTQNFTASGGSGDLSWAIYSGTLPVGLSLDQESGELSGTPEETPKSTIIVSVTDNGNRVTYKAFTISIASSLLILTTNIPDGLAGSDFSETIRVSGGVKPYTFTYEGLSLNNLNLDENTGVISANPATAGCTNMEITVSDSSTPIPQENTAITGFCITDDLTITTPAVLPDGEVETEITPIQLLAGGGGDLQSYTWEHTPGTLPPGIDIDDQSLSGTPTDAGEFNFTIQFTDGDSDTVEKEFFMRISESFGISTTNLPIATTNSIYYSTINAKGALKPYSWLLTSGNLPDGLSFNPETATISGTPTLQQESHFTIRVTSANNPAFVVEKELRLAVRDDPSLKEVPNVSSPENGATSITSGQTIAWADSGDDIHYDVYLGTNEADVIAADSDLLVAENLDDTTFTPDIILETTYYCKIVAHGTNGGEIISSISSFSTYEENQPPTIPTPSHNGVSGVAVDVELSWSCSDPDGDDSKLRYDVYLLCSDDGGWLDLVAPGNLVSANQFETTYSPGALQPNSQYFWKVVAKDNADAIASVLFWSFSTRNNNITIVNDVLANPEQTTPYTTQLVVNGGEPPYVFSISEGNLPEGLTLNEAGLITGTAGILGSNYTFTVQAKDSPTTGFPSVIEKEFTISVIPPWVFTTEEMTVATQSSLYNIQIESSGDSGPYTWSLDGKLPIGLSLTDEGYITGTTNEYGVFKFTVIIEDQAESTIRKEYTLSVTPSNDYSISGVVLSDTSYSITLSDGSENSITTINDGAYQFEHLTSGHYTITPTQEDYFFIPSQIEVDINFQSTSGNDFTAYRKDIFLAESTDGSFKLSWDNLNFDNPNFDLYVGIDKNSLKNITTIDSDTSTSYSVEGLNADTTYYWKIILNDGLKKLDGPVWEFNTTVATIELLTPEDSGEGISPDTFLEWFDNNPTDEPRTYNVYWKTSSLYEFSPVIENHVGNELSLSAIQTDPETIYYFKITDSETGENTSNIISFKTAPMTSAQATADEQKSGGGGSSSKWYSCFIQSL